jgi:hypothetical protein
VVQHGGYQMKHREIEFDGFTFENMSETFEYIQGRLDVLYKSDFWSDAEKNFQSMVIMKQFNNTVYNNYKELIK